MPYAHVNRTALYYDAQGSGPPLVFVAGLGLSQAVWAQQVAHFSRGNRVVTVDLRGAGRSGRLRTWRGVVETHVSDLLALLDKLELERVVLCGGGYGGLVAQRAALERPAACRGLVLADPPGEAGPSGALLAPLHLLPRAWLAGGAERHYARWPQAQERMKAEARGLRGGEALRVRLASRGLRLGEGLEGLACPVLALAADSPAVRRSGRELVERLPQARLKVLEDATEPCNLCQPYAFNAVVTGFLRELGWSRLVAPDPQKAKEASAP